VHLSDLEKHQEWRHYLVSKKLGRKPTAKKPDAKYPI